MQHIRPAIVFIVLLTLLTTGWLHDDVPPAVDVHPAAAASQ